ncbi:MAG: ATP-binding protein, partial [Opitutaceae bacterium]
GRVQDILPVPEGLLAAGLRGVKEIRDAQVRWILQTNGDANAIRFSKLRNGELLVAVSTGEIVATNLAGESSTVVRNLRPAATGLVEDHAGNLWLSSFGHGLQVARLNAELPTHAEPVPASFGLPALAGETFLQATQDGSVLVIADNGAWVKLAGATRFQPVTNFPSRRIVAVCDFVGENAWVLHASTPDFAPCVARVALRNGGAIWEPLSLPALDKVGMPRSIFAEKLPDDDSTTLWIGGSTAVLRALTGSVFSAPVPQPPLLRSLARKKDSTVGPVTALLPFSTRSIEFEFALPDFARRPLLHFETRIDGIDQDWVRAGRDSRRELTALRDGDYAFHVRAVAETGIVGPATTVAFRITPPWWRTMPALAGFILALGPIGYAAYALRIRALRRRNVDLEAKVRERTQQLEEASAAKTEFVANMSHDIRNPLNGIVGLTLALEDSQLDPKQRGLVATLRECTSYLSTLVDDVLDFASIEAGRIELRVDPFVPAELLSSVVTTLEGEAASKAANLSVEVDPRLPACLAGDAGRIQQILVNYVSNALKYAGGSIHVSAAIAAGAPDEIEFSVADTGPGISAAEQATLFTKFTRLSSPQRAEVQGTGLGLASCRLLADLMGGSVGVASLPGHGARFFLRLPLTPATATVEPVLGDLPNTTVLLVEDTDYNALAATAVLRRLGLTCERARTGEEALRLFAAKRFNLVLLDRNLPDMDGTEIARRMRAIEADGSPALLLAVTAYCTAEDKQLCLDAGMDAFVGKPLTPEKLRKILFAASRRLLGAATFAGGPETHAPGGLDTSMLDFLSDGTGQGLSEQIDRFLAILLEGKATLAATAAASDFSALGDAAHRLKGHAVMIRAGELADVLARLEASARVADDAGCHSALRRVDEQVAAVTAALHRRRSAARTT